MHCKLVEDDHTSTQFNNMGQYCLLGKARKNKDQYFLYLECTQGVFKIDSKQRNYKLLFIYIYCLYKLLLYIPKLMSFNYTHIHWPSFRDYLFLSQINFYLFRAFVYNY